MPLPPLNSGSSPHFTPMAYPVHPNPAPAPCVAIRAVSAPSNFAAVFTAFILLASHVRPKALHFVVQVSLFLAAFTQLTSETQGGLEATSRVKPLPHTQADTVVAPPAPDAADAEPHDLQTGFAVGTFQYPTAQMHDDAAAGAAGLDVSTAPHVTQGGVAVGSFQ